MSELVVDVHNLGKKYRLGALQERHDTLRDAVTSGMQNMFRRNLNPGGTEEFWAVRDVNFQVNRGEVVGIIGRNGAGKSTVLKLLSRITSPTEGEIRVKGRVGTLLEVGTGFHPELSGRENIYLNGAILGMTRQEINNKFDEIVAFSEIEKFIDTPVKRYSSGMYIRLAFSVAAHLEPDILLVDEVLAVGDVAFQRKCLGKMSDIAEGGRTVIFVSHNMAAVTRLCERVILLDGGQIVADTDAEAAVSQYLMRADSSEGLRMLDAGNPDVARITAIGTKNSAGDYTSSLKVSEEFCINIQCEIKQEIREAQVAIAVLAIDGTVIFVTAHSDQLSREDAVLKPGTYGFSIQIPAHFLNVGNYALNVRIWGVVSGGVRTSHAAAMQEYNFSIEEVGSIASRMNDRRGGYITPILEWTLEHE